MSKRNTTEAQVTSKQQVSKILLGQIMSDAKGIANSYHETATKISMLKRGIAYELINSGYNKNHSLTGWHSNEFEFHFEYGRRGGVRVSYMNNQGLQSTVFQADEWGCTMNYIKRKLDSIIDNLTEQQRAERMQAAEDRFNKAVEAAVLKALSKEKAGNLYRAIDDIAELAAEKVADEKHVVEACKAVRREVNLKSEISDDELY